MNLGQLETYNDVTNVIYLLFFVYRLSNFIQHSVMCKFNHIDAILEESVRVDF